MALTPAIFILGPSARDLGERLARHLPAELRAPEDVKGELRRASGEQDAAAECLQRAMAVAHHQQARLSELSAAVALAGLWRDRGRRDDAYNLISPLYAWFTEGFATPDLRAAATLLDQRGHAPA